MNDAVNVVAVVVIAAAVAVDAAVNVTLAMLVLSLSLTKSMWSYYYRLHSLCHWMLTSVLPMCKTTCQH